MVFEPSAGDFYLLPVGAALPEACGMSGVAELMTHCYLNGGLPKIFPS
jgi:hypothetical protein